jgi:O-antigen/teichoic acid export membrane protein
MTTMKQMMDDVSILIRGSVFAQLIGVLLMPILSRLFSPEDFGAFGLFQAAMLLISVAACMRYDQAILVAENDAEAFGLFRLCILLALLISLIILLIVVLLKIFGLDGPWMASVSLFWLVPATFVAGMGLAATSMFTRLGVFRVASNARIFQTVLNGTVAIILGLSSPSAWGLVFADTIGKLAMIGGGIRILLPCISWRAWLSESPALARRYIIFPKVSVAGGLLNNGGYFVTRVALFTLFGAEVNGQFALADRVIALPVGLVVVAVSQVFTSHYSRLLRDDPASAQIYLRRIVLYSALIGLPPMLIGIGLAPLLFPLFFGAQWAEAGQFAQILGVMYYSSIVSGPIQTALVVSGHMSWQFYWEALRLVLLLVLWLGVWWQQWDVYVALTGFALITAMLSFVYVWLAWFLVHVEKGTRET